MTSVIIDKNGVGRKYDKYLQTDRLIIDPKFSGLWVTSEELNGHFIAKDIDRIEWRFNVKIKNKDEIEQILKR